MPLASMDLQGYVTTPGLADGYNTVRVVVDHSLPSIPVPQPGRRTKYAEMEGQKLERRRRRRDAMAKGRGGIQATRCALGGRFIMQGAGGVALVVGLKGYWDSEQVL